MGVQIIIDSASDMLMEDAQRRGLVFIPLTTRIGEKEYEDGVTLTHAEFYRLLEDCKSMPKTSQIAPFAFSKAIGEALGRGDEVLIITMSEKLSGTLQSALSAAGEHKGEIYVIDSQSVAVGERILIEYAIRLRDNGLGAKEIAEKLNRQKKRICLLSIFDTLEYLVRGGRMSKTVGLAGILLKIKPLMSMVDGSIVVLGKARGHKMGNNLLNETLEKKGGVDFSMPYMLSYSGKDDSLLKDYIETSKNIWKKAMKDLPISTIGSTVGTHAGPGAIALAFFALGV